MLIEANEAALTQCADVNPESADLRNFAHGRPDDRTKTVASDIERQSQGCWNLCDAEHLHDVLQTRGIDGRSNVDGECEKAYLEGHEELLRSRPVPRVLRKIISNHII